MCVECALLMQFTFELMKVASVVSNLNLHQFHERINLNDTLVSFRLSVGSVDLCRKNVLAMTQLGDTKMNLIISDEGARCAYFKT